MSLCPGSSCSVFFWFRTRRARRLQLNISLENLSVLALARTFHGFQVHPDVHFSHTVSESPGNSQRTFLCSLAQYLLLTCIVGECGRVQERGTRLLETPQFVEQIAAHGVQQVVVA